MKTPTSVRKGAWSREEDLLLTRSIQKYGEGKWHLIPQRAGLNRCRKSCRLRWLNYLHPGVKREQFKEDEADLITKMHKLLGNRWSLIAGRLPGRTANDVKNYWNSHLSKKLGLPKSDGFLCHLKPRRHEVIRPRPICFTSRVTSRGLHVSTSSSPRGQQQQQQQQHESLHPSDEHIISWNSLLLRADLNSKEGQSTDSQIEATVEAMELQKMKCDCAGTGVQWDDLRSMNTWLLDD